VLVVLAVELLVLVVLKVLVVVVVVDVAGASPSHSKRNSKVSPLVSSSSVVINISPPEVHTT
jgi:hypothetical protein